MGGMSLLVVYWNFKYTKPLTLFLPIYLYSIFILILVLFSSNILYSSKIYLKTFCSIWLFPVSFYLINDLSKLRQINQKLLWFMIIYILNFFLMNIFDISLKGYGDVIQTGNLFSEVLNSMAYLIVYSPLIFFLNPNKQFNKYIFLLITLVFIIGIITLKRISVVATIFGLVLFLYNYSGKVKTIRYLLLGFVILAVSYPIYSPYLNRQLEIRSNKLSFENIDKEARWLESKYIYIKIFSFKNPINSFFGTEMFNSPRKYAPTKKFGDRQIHNDYFRLLHGSGIVGIFLYFLLQFSIIKSYIRIRNHTALYVQKDLFSLLNAIFYSFYFISFIISLSGGIDGILFNSLRYIVLGGIIGIFYNANNFATTANKLKFNIINKDLNTNET